MARAPRPQTATRSRDEPDGEVGGPPRCALFEVLRAGVASYVARRIPVDAADAIAIGRGRGEALEGRRLVVGLDDDRASGRHAEIVRGLGVWILHDRDSKNGTSGGTACSSTRSPTAT